MIISLFMLFMFATFSNEDGVNALPFLLFGILETIIWVNIL